jgi:hypothetical protein
MNKQEFKKAFAIAEKFEIDLPSYFGIEVVDAIDSKQFLTTNQLASIIRAEGFSLNGTPLGSELDNTFKAYKKYTILN